MTALRPVTRPVVRPRMVLVPRTLDNSQQSIIMSASRGAFSATAVYATQGSSCAQSAQHCCGEPACVRLVVREVAREPAGRLGVAPTEQRLEPREHLVGLAERGDETPHAQRVRRATPRGARSEGGRAGGKRSCEFATNAERRAAKAARRADALAAELPQEYAALESAAAQVPSEAWRRATFRGMLLARGGPEGDALHTLRRYDPSLRPSLRATWSLQTKTTPLTS